MIKKQNKKQQSSQAQQNSPSQGHVTFSSKSDNKTFWSFSNKPGEQNKQDEISEQQKIKMFLLDKIRYALQTSTIDRKYYLLSQSQQIIETLDIIQLNKMFQSQSDITNYINIYTNKQYTAIPDNLSIRLQSNYANIHKIRYIIGDFKQQYTTEPKYLNILMEKLPEQIVIPIMELIKLPNGSHIDAVNAQNGDCSTTRTNNGQNYKIKNNQQFNVIMYVNSTDDVSKKLPENIYAFVLISNIKLYYCPLQQQNFNHLASLSLTSCQSVPLQKCQNLKFLKLSQVYDVSLVKLNNLSKLQKLYFKEIKQQEQNQLVVDYILKNIKVWSRLNMLHLIKCSSGKQLTINTELCILEDLCIQNDNNDYILTFNISQNQCKFLKCISINGILQAHDFDNRLIVCNCKDFQRLGGESNNRKIFQLRAEKEVAQNTQLQISTVENSINIISEKITERKNQIIQLHYAPIEKYVISQYRRLYMQENEKQNAQEKIMQDLPTYIYFTDVSNDWELKSIVSQLTKVCMLLEINFHDQKIKEICFHLFQIMEQSHILTKQIITNQSIICTKNITTKEINIYKHPVDFIQQQYIACITNDFTAKYENEPQIQYNKQDCYDVIIVMYQQIQKIILPEQIRNMYYYGNFEAIIFPKINYQEIQSMSIQCAQFPNLSEYKSLKQLSLMSVYDVNIDQIPKLYNLINVQLINIEFKQTIKIESPLIYGIDKESRIQQIHGTSLLQNLLQMNTINFLMVNMFVEKQLTISVMSESLKLIRINYKELKEVHLNINIQQYTELKVLDVQQACLYLNKVPESVFCRAQKIINRE